jgi:hypothetical protein
MIGQSGANWSYKRSASTRLQAYKKIGKNE